SDIATTIGDMQSQLASAGIHATTTITVEQGSIDAAVAAVASAFMSKPIVVSLQPSISGAPDMMPGSTTSAFAVGGHVTGPGTETSDSIMAFLSHNEFVTNAKAVK